MVSENLLQEIGLSNWESQAYLALLELGSTTTGPLVQKSEIPQSKIYGVLESLIKKGLCNYIIKGKIKHFQAASPDRILALFKEKQKKVESILQSLKAKQSEKKQSVELFEGAKALRGMFLGMISNIKKNEDWYGFSTGETSTDPEIQEFYEWWGALKLNAGLNDHLLISSYNKKEFEKAQSLEAIRAMKQSILRYSLVSFPGDVAIFRNQVVILNWVGKPTGILITSEELAKQYKDFFLGIWEHAKKP